MISNLPPISIAIPFYNAEATLLNAVRSIYAQTHQNWELILIDDGSTDRSLELAHSIKDPRVKVYSDGQNRRLAARLNQIPDLATYDYLARMDADDLISPVRLERQLHYLKTHPNVDLVSTGVCSLSDQYEPISFRCVSENHELIAKNLLLGRSGIVHASLIGKKSWFARNHYSEDKRNSEDSNLWVRAFSRRDLQVGFISEPLYYYREDGNVTLSKLKTAYREGIKTIIKDSGQGFSTREKMHGLSLTLAKLLAVQVLSASGSLKYLRNRRNSTALTSQQRNELQKEIQKILDFTLPL